MRVRGWARYSAAWSRLASSRSASVAGASPSGSTFHRALGACSQSGPRWPARSGRPAGARRCSPAGSAAAPRPGHARHAWNRCAGRRAAAADRPLPQPVQGQVQHTLWSSAVHQTVPELAQHGMVEPGIGQLRPRRSFESMRPRRAAAVWRFRQPLRELRHRHDRQLMRWPGGVTSLKEQIGEVLVGEQRPGRLPDPYAHTGLRERQPGHSTVWAGPHPADAYAASHPDHLMLVPPRRSGHHPATTQGRLETIAEFASGVLCRTPSQLA